MDSQRRVLGMQATGKHLRKSTTSIAKNQSSVSSFCYARNRVWEAVDALCLRSFNFPF